MLEADDPRLAAETLLSLARGKLHLKRMLGQIPEPDEAAIDACAKRAVVQFLRVCRPLVL
jgi:TetR/AcrR family transcriptional regulator, mexJK operon transcriptional repressor